MLSSPDSSSSSLSVCSKRVPVLQPGEESLWEFLLSFCLICLDGHVASYFPLQTPRPVLRLLQESPRDRAWRARRWAGSLREFLLSVCLICLDCHVASCFLLQTPRPVLRRLRRSRGAPAWRARRWAGSFCLAFVSSALIVMSHRTFLSRLLV